MPDPNNIVLTKYPLVFMLIPKVANTSMKLAMLRSIGVNAKFPGLNHYMASARANQHIFRIANKKRLATEYTDHLKIAFVRNPLDRIVSAYKNKVIQNLHRPYKEYGLTQLDTLDRFVDVVTQYKDAEADQHIRAQYFDLYHNDKRVPDYIGKFETLKADWKHVQMLVKEKCGLDLIDMPHVNQARAINLDVSDYVKTRVYDYYAQDYEAFGYD